MKKRIPLNAWLVVALAGVVGLVLLMRSTPGPEAGQRKILYYQDSMHPWIKLDQPGKCTICAMDLTPIYEGEAAAALGDDVVLLGRDSVTVMNVRTEEVSRRPLELTLHVAGTLEANETRKTVLAAPAAGRVEVLNVDYAGVEVEEGQVLMTFYSPELALEKRRYLVRSRISSHPRDPYAATPTSALDLAKVSVEADPYFQDLVSPQSGTVLDRNVYQGQYVAEGDRLFTIADSSALWFRFDVYENQLAWLASGQTLEVTVSALPGKTFPAVISFIEPTLDPVTRTVKVRADIANPEVEVPGGQRMRLLRYGMYADGYVRVELPDVLSVSRSAVLMPGARAYAYVDKGEGAYERRRVQVGRQGDLRWEILQGLDEGDRVVTAGNVLIDAQAQFLQQEEREDLEPLAPRGPAVGLGMGEPAPMTVGDGGAGPVGLAPAQEAALTAVLAAADGLSAALAADDLELVHQRAAGLASVAATLSTAFPAGHPWHESAERVAAAAAWGKPADLAAARGSFLPFSTAVVDWAQQVRRQPGTVADFKVYHCPMAPKPGLWVQWAGPLQNPFYGAKMLRCGEEVPPLKPWAAAAPMAPAPEHLMPKPTGATSPTVMPMAAESAPSHAMPKMAESTPPVEPPEAAAMEMPMDEPGAAPEASPAVAMPERVMPPQLPQDAGPGIRSGRRSMGMAFWQRASELYASTRQDTAATNVPTALQPPTEDQQAVGRFIDAAGALSAALAADDLDGFNQALALVGKALPSLEATFAAPHPWNPVVRKVGMASRGGPAADLEEARRRFLPLSVNLVELGRRLREDEPMFAGLKIYQCPMAPPPGVWLQTEGPLRNPFYGAKMLTCGEEVKP